MYLIVGASSFIGKHLYEYCKACGIDVYGTYFTHSDYPDWIKFDICRQEIEDIYSKFFSGKKLDSVIVCSADSSIDSCKRNAAASYQLNVLSTKKLLAKAEQLGAKCVFLSSEAVFDGKTGLYSEEDNPNPLTLYDRQKLEMEQYISQNLKNYLIFRISRAVGSRYGENDIFHEFYSKITEQKEITCLQNQSFCLTEVNDIAKVIVKSLELGIQGLLHLSSGNYVSRYELAQLYARKIFGGYHKITEKQYAEIPFADFRHIYGGLNGSRLAELTSFQYMGMKEIIDKYASSIPDSQVLKK